MKVDEDDAEKDDDDDIEDGDDDACNFSACLGRGKVQRGWTAKPDPRGGGAWLSPPPAERAPYFPSWQLSSLPQSSNTSGAPPIHCPLDRTKGTIHSTSETNVRRRHRSPRLLITK